jgi:hypothetical protein
MNEQSRACTVIYRPDIGVRGLNLFVGMVYMSTLFCVCVVCVGRGLTTDRSPVQRVLPNVCKDYEGPQKGRPFAALVCIKCM